MLKSLIKSFVLLLVRWGLLSELSVKEWSEWMYWRTHKKGNEPLSNWHYEEFYTSFWGLDSSFYNEKSVLDIGCGPRGSLEWADMTTRRVGLDPLVDKYLSLGADKHQMEYVKAYSEQMPFDDGTFDVVCAFNSVDHVDDLTKTCQEIMRVTKSGGTFLLITDIHEEPTLNEPQIIQWDLAKTSFDSLLVEDEFHLEKVEGKGVYDSLRARIKFDHSNNASRYGMLCIRMKKP